MKRNGFNLTRLTALLLSLIFILLSFTACEIPTLPFDDGTDGGNAPSVSLDSIPDFDGTGV